MFDESASGWRTAYESGAVVLRTGGQLLRFLAGLWVGFLGVCMLVVTAFGLAMPDGELVKSYVELVAGVKAAAMPVPAASQPMIEIYGHVMPMLAAVVIGVRLALVAGLLLAVGIINAASKFWREG
jgi:hypothetical protein